MEVVPSILTTEQEQNMEQGIVMLNVQKHLLSMDKQTLILGGLMVLVVLNLIFGKQTKKQLFLLLIHAIKKDTIVAIMNQSVDLVVIDIMVCVIKMDMELIHINTNQMFYGPGSNYRVDTTKPFTVVTQFLTNNNTD